MLIEDTIRFISEKLPEPPLSSLTGFMEDCKLCFQDEASVLEIRREDQREPKLIINVSLLKSFSSLRQLKEGVSQKVQPLMYEHYSSITIGVFRESLVIRFITVPRSERYFISGAFLFDSPSFEELIEQWQKSISEAVPLLATCEFLK